MCMCMSIHSGDTNVQNFLSQKSLRTKKNFLLFTYSSTTYRIYFILLFYYIHNILYVVYYTDVIFIFEKHNEKCVIS
jgi:hypothetical protein